MPDEQTSKYRQLGLNIAYYRKQRGFTQAQLADKLNISRTHVSRIEKANYSMASLDIIFKICDVLSVSPKKLFDFETDNR